jgi:hypothetical protein
VSALGRLGVCMSGSRAGFVVGGVTVGLVSGDLLAGGARNGLDQVVAVVVDAQGRFVDFDGDDLTGIAQPDRDALAAPPTATGRTRSECPPDRTLRCTRAGRWSSSGAGPGVRVPWRWGVG